MDKYTHAHTHTHRPIHNTHKRTQISTDVVRGVRLAPTLVLRRAANGEDVPNGSSVTKQQLNSAVQNNGEIKFIS